MSDYIRFPKSYAYQILVAGIISLFFLLFSFIYDPFQIQEKFAGVGGLGFPFHLLMLTSIMMFTLAVSRLVLWGLLFSHKFQVWRYSLFCVVEVVAVSAFASLYSSLFLHETFFSVLADSVLGLVLLMIYPYTIHILARVAANRQHDLFSKSDKESLVKFYDENKKLKLAVDSKALIFIAADANYVNIVYLENERTKEYLLRSSMKKISEIAEQNGLVRCHRSYFVNPKHIKSVSRNKDGMITASLKEDGLKLLPVSKSYYDSLAELI